MPITMEERRAELVRQLKLCGASIVENAESIIGMEEHLAGVTVRIYLDFNEAPHINVDRDFYP